MNTSRDRQRFIKLAVMLITAPLLFVGLLLVLQAIHESGTDKLKALKKHNINILITNHSPAGFQINVDDDALYMDGTIGYRLESQDGRRIAILQRPAIRGSGNLVTLREMHARNWRSIRRIDVHDREVYVGQSEPDRSPARTAVFVSHGMLVNVHTIDQVSDAEMILIIESMD